VSSGVFAERIVLALLLGAVIGIERQWRQRMAGLRTNALVAVGAALFASISILMNATINPTQVAAYVVSGIGFLAGAVIFKEGFNLRGLNTAATLWATAAVGTLCGSGFAADATIGAAVVLSANVFLRPIVARINRQPLEQTELAQVYEVAVTCLEPQEEAVRREGARPNPRDDADAARPRESQRRSGSRPRDGKRCYNQSSRRETRADRRPPQFRSDDFSRKLANRRRRKPRPQHRNRRVTAPRV
jgi:uncharacterized membrane protein YhiD involved in acid resistance